MIFKLVFAVLIISQVTNCKQMEEKDVIDHTRQVLSYDCNEPFNIKTFVLDEDEQCRKNSQKTENI